MLRVLHIAGARPNFIKIAPLMREIDASNRRDASFEQKLVHTGQHYDRQMSGIFFEELGIREPDIDLQIGSHSHAVQVAKMMVELEKVFVAEKPGLVIVVGDVNSTVAASLVASKMGIRLAHVEAGLRSFDRTMPEEINRILTDSISDLLFTSCPEADENLRREGISPSKIHFVGNIMIDTLMVNLNKTDAPRVLRGLGLRPKAFGLLTLHRPSNVDDPGRLGAILDAVEVLQRKIPIVFPVHPRTQKIIQQNPAFRGKIASMKQLIFTEPLGYLDFLALQKECRICLTDSGGIQEESTFLKIPCITLRENTERPVTVTHGTNMLAGLDRDRIVELSEMAMNGHAQAPEPPELWDGHTAERIVSVLQEWHKRGLNPA